MSDVVITGIGALTAVGPTAAQTCASVRAGINRFREWDDYLLELPEPEWDDPEPLQACRVEGLTDDAARLPRLAVGAMQDLVVSAGIAREAFARAQIFAVVPEARGDWQAPAAEQVREMLSRAAGGQVRGVSVVTGGHAAAIDAIAAAGEHVRTHDAPAVVVGFDSWQEVEVLDWLDDSGLLRCRRHPDGFLPGEAGAALWLEPASAAHARGAAILARIGPSARAQESRPQTSGDPSSAAGLCDAVSAAAADLPGIEWVATDLNGERYRAFEWGLCRVRLAERFAEPFTLWHPADCLGDVGSASGVVLAVLVARAFERGYAPGSDCLVIAGSAEGARSAIVLARPN